MYEMILKSWNFLPKSKNFYRNTNTSEIKRYVFKFHHSFQNFQTGFSSKSQDSLQCSRMIFGILELPQKHPNSYRNLRIFKNSSNLLNLITSELSISTEIPELPSKSQNSYRNPKISTRYPELAPKFLIAH